MKDLPLVSVVIPVYNGRRYLPELLESLTGQTYPAIEIILVDDCSSDGSREVLQDYAARDDRIHLFCNSENLGVGRNFDRALRLARGEYIFQGDQDDIWLENKVEAMTGELAQGAGLVYCDLQVIDEMGRMMAASFHGLIGKKNWYSTDAARLRRHLLFGNISPGCSMAFHRSLLDYILPVPDYLDEDWWVMLQAVQHGKILRMGGPLMKYRLHSANAIGLRIEIKGREQRVSETEQARARLERLGQETNMFHDSLIARLQDYYRLRSEFLLGEENLPGYLSGTLKMMGRAPRIYQHLLRNYLEDCHPGLYTLGLGMWRRLRMYKSREAGRPE